MMVCGDVFSDFVKWKFPYYNMLYLDNEKLWKVQESYNNGADCMLPHFHDIK